jgi:hypothetical protein
MREAIDILFARSASPADGAWMCRVQGAMFHLPRVDRCMWGVVLARDRMCICFATGVPFGWLSTPLVRACTRLGEEGGKTLRRLIIHGS